MKMQNWINARSVQLLTDINNTPYTDDCEEIKMQLILGAMRESSIELFYRAAENSRKEIEKINKNAMQEAILEVETKITENFETIKAGVVKEEAKEEKPEPKIKISSSLIRRVDFF
ncbi:MAG: hypothetical protein GY829_00185 [Gammaproteobacteria bacterium]|nr:hypothetical protein [Gammaproteobacteria bacterium]